MKKLILLLFTLAASFSIIAQEIPNAGFENWTDGFPNGWFADNSPGFPPFIPAYYPITQNSDAHTGSSSVKLEVFNIGDTLAIEGWIWSTFPVTQNYGSLTGYYKFVPHNANDLLSVSVIMFRNTYVFGFFGIGDWETNTAASEYTQFTVPINYDSSGVVDSAWIFISMENTEDSTTPGGYALIDDLSWGPAVGVEKVNSNIPAAYELKQNYPNPFNPATMIEFTIPKESFVELKVYDIIGNEVSTLVNEYHQAGTFRTEFNATGLSSGIYLAKLTAGSFAKTMKMTLLK